MSKQLDGYEICKEEITTNEICTNETLEKYLEYFRKRIDSMFDDWLEYGQYVKDLYGAFDKANKILNNLLRPKVKELLNSNMKFVHFQLEDEIDKYFKEVIFPIIEKECKVTLNVSDVIIGLIEDREKIGHLIAYTNF